MYFVDNPLKTNILLTKNGGLCCESAKSCGENRLNRSRKNVIFSNKRITRSDFFQIFSLTRIVTGWV